MEYGLMTEPQLGMTYDELRRLAQMAERSGLTAFARSDHYLFPRVEGPHATDAFVTLGGLARETESIELVVLVSPITFRHPGVIAKMAGSLDEMTGGRFSLGLGTGWMEEEHAGFGLDFPELGERFDRLEEALGYMAAAFRGETFDGAHYTLTESQVKPRPERCRVIVGGGGPHRTPRLAGTFADEFNLPFRPLDEVAVRIERARQAAGKHDRDPEALVVSLMGAGIVGSDRAEFEENLARVAAADPFGREAADLEQSMRDRGMPVGTADEVAARLEELEAAGVGRWYLQHFGPYDDDLVESMLAALPR